MTVEEIFHAVRGLPLAEREGYLAAHCPDSGVRRQVEELLAAEAHAGDFLQAPATGANPDEYTAGFENSAPPDRIGPYKLLQRLGEGGMGEVWMAEQSVPVHRKVALKVIKAGLDSRQVLARFEAERQALAL